MATKKLDPKKYLGRIDEDYLLDQWHQSTKRESFRMWKDRIESFNRIYRGDWQFKTADGEVRNVKPLIENLAKNAVHDISGLAHEARSSVKVYPLTETTAGYKAAAVKEAAADTTYQENRGRAMERKLYMDLIGTGAALVACSFIDGNDYPIITRLNPDFCYPDVRNGRIQDLVYVETMKLRAAARMYPKVGEKFPMLEAWAQESCDIIEYYDSEEVVRAAVVKSKKASDTPDVIVLDRWVHKLKCIPVAYEELDTHDDALRGMLDQVEGPLLARNDIMQYIMDYVESAVHAPFEEKNIINSEDMPGPFTVYHHDSTTQDSFMRRVQPAAPMNEVAGVIQYLEGQAGLEAIQPPGRQGSVRQSIASASFVNSTLGRLTTVVEELQEKMISLRKQVTDICFEIDVKWLDFDKPMVRPIGRKRMYKPSSDIGDTYFCQVQFGAMAGLDKLQGDQRVLQHLGARLIPRSVARREVDYLDDPENMQDLIDYEDMMDALKGRIAQDPRVTPGVAAQIVLAQSDGDSLIEAVKKVIPDLLALPAAQPPAAPGAPGQMPSPTTGPAQTPQEQAAALQGGATGAPAVPAPQFAPPPLEQILAGTRGGQGR